MHYFVDGYNLLFRFASKAKSSLQSKRENIITALNEEAITLSLNITLVFDGSQPKPAEASRGHFDALEIVYTPEDQTADQYIIRELESSANPHQEVVVTSDRALAQRCSLLKAQTQSIETFIGSLVTKHRKKKKKLQQASPSQQAFQDTDFHINRLLKIFEDKLKDH